MSGEVITYNTHKPMCFKEFKKMPTDLQSDYLTYLINEKRAQCKDIADMLQITPSTLSHVFKTLRVDKSRATGRTDEDKAIWRAFLNGETPEIVEPEEATEVETVVEEKTTEKRKTVYGGGTNVFRNVDVNGLDDIVRWLKFVVSDGMDITITIEEGNA